MVIFAVLYLKPQSPLKSTPSAHALSRNVTVIDELILSNYDETKIYRSARQVNCHARLISVQNFAE